MRRRAARWRHRWVAVLLIVSGIVVALQPVVETFVHDWQGLSAVDEYSQSVASVAPDVLDEQYRAASAYNSGLTPQALSDPWSDDEAATSADHDAYTTELSAFGPLGRIRLPAVGIDLPIYHDATRYSLGLGAGHMYGTSLPVGGAGTHAVIAGHTGATIRTYFNRLNEAVVGDLIYIDTVGRTLVYRIDQIQVVSKKDLSQIQPIPGEDLLTMVTCIIGHKSERLLVRGVRTEDPGAGDAGGTLTAPTPASLDLRPQSWMIPRLVIAASGLALVSTMMIVWVVSDRRHEGDTHPHDEVVQP